MISFKEFLNEAGEEEYTKYLDQVMTLMDAEQVDTVEIGDKTITISGEDYIEKNSDDEIVKTQKLFKDGDSTNFDIAVVRLKEFIKAIKDGNVVEPKAEE